MYTIFFTINCVEQLIFSKTFVDHLQFEQLIFFCLKVKLLESSWSPKINWIQAVNKKNNYCSNGVKQMKNCVDQFFQANEFRAVDHDPMKPWVAKSRGLLRFECMKRFLIVYYCQFSGFCSSWLKLLDDCWYFSTLQNFFFLF